MARYQKKKDFGLGKPTKQEQSTAIKMANMAQGKPANSSTSGSKKLSAAMYTWAKTNMSKLKNPTKAQKKIFEKYKAMKAAGDNPANPKPRPTKATNATKPAEVKPAQPAKKPPVKKPTGSGVTGSFRKSNPPSPTVTARPKAGSRATVKKEDPRETGRKRNLREAQAAKARRQRKEQFTKKPYGGIASSPPKNPKEGDMYKKPFGPVMIYKNGKFVRK